MRIVKILYLLRKGELKKECESGESGEGSYGRNMGRVSFIILEQKNLRSVPEESNASF